MPRLTCLLLCVLAGCVPPDSRAQALAAWASCHDRIGGSPRVLVFTRTTGYRHSSIPIGVEALRRVGEELGFGVEHTEDATRFRADDLRRYRAVVFLNTTGDVLDASQQAAFEAFVASGGGFVGVHSAADTEYDWPWYGRLVGAWFASHPATQEGRLDVADADHPATRCLPAPWTRVDEWYDFRAHPEAGVRILLAIDESTYGGARMGEPHPMAWAHELLGGRAFYTALGHTAESYVEPDFLNHLAGGILWVLAGDS